LKRADTEEKEKNEIEFDVEDMRRSILHDRK